MAPALDPAAGLGARADAALGAGAVDPGALAEVLPDGVVVLDAAGRAMYVNEAGAAMIGTTPEWCRGRSMAEFVHPDDLMLALSSLEAVAGKIRGTPIELRLQGPRGGWRLMELVGRDCLDVPGIEGIVCTVRDLTERRMWEVARNDVAKFQQIVQHAAAIVMSVDADGVVSAVNGAFGRLLGHDPTTVVGASLSDFAAGGHEDVLSQALGDALRLGAASVEVPLRHARLQSPVPLRLELVDLTADPVVGSVVVTGQDVSDLHQARLRLEHLASHDSLTGLPNRSVLDALLGDLVPTGRPLAVLFVDLDGFKAVNDTFGHGAGDELLCHVAGRLAGGVAEGDLVARVGGDEFVVVSIDVAGRHQAQELALRLERLLDGPYRLRDGVASIGASVGVVCSNPGSSARDLLAAADRAMYDAKARRWGRGI